MTLESEISELERIINEKRKKLIELKKQLGQEEIAEYSLLDHHQKPVMIRDLFGDQDDLIVIHNMGKSCSYCTLWADGFNNLTEHFEDRAAFVVVTPDPPAVQKAFADDRGWKFKMLSNEGSTFIEDMGFKYEDEGKSHWMPGVSTFHQTEEGKIVRIAKDYFGPGDPYCSIWHFFDLLATGTNEWEPQFNY